MTPYIVNQACRKRGFASPRAALGANRRNGHALRVYRCSCCKRWHVSKAEYR